MRVRDGVRRPLRADVNVDMLAIDPYAPTRAISDPRPNRSPIRREELALRALFNEELGAVVQVARADRDRSARVACASTALGARACRRQRQRRGHDPRIRRRRVDVRAPREPNCCRSGRRPASGSRGFATIRTAPTRSGSWPAAARPSTSRSAAPFRKRPCAAAGWRVVPGAVAAPAVVTSRPRVAVLREQGVNSQREMAAAFDLAGFDAFDVHMSDLVAGRHQLENFQALVACGGFSYGDVLGGGQWLGQRRAVQRATRPRPSPPSSIGRDTLTLGVCNGCQMMSQLRPDSGRGHWPRFVRNRSGSYEAARRWSRSSRARSRWFEEMAGSRLPIAVAHGEGARRFRRAGGVAEPERAPAGDALRRRRRPADRALSVEPERLGRRHHRLHAATTAGRRS